MKPYFMAVYTAAQLSCPTLPSAPSASFAVQRNWNEAGARPTKGLPVLAVERKPLLEKLQNAYRRVTDGDMAGALANLQEILHAAPLLVASSRSEANDIRELLSVTSEYASACRLEVQRREVAATKTPEVQLRVAELAAYFTNCNLQPLHLLLALKSAMVQTAKMKNFKTAAVFAHRLIEMESVATQKRPEISNKARQVLQHCQANPGDAIPMNYDERNPFVLCNEEFVPIYKGSPLSRCSYCGASYQPKFKGKLCNNCGIG